MYNNPYYGSESPRSRIHSQFDDVESRSRERQAQYSGLSSSPKASPAEMEEQEQYVERLNAMGQSLKLIGIEEVIPCRIVRGEQVAYLLFSESQPFKRLYPGVGLVQGVAEFWRVFLEVNGEVKRAYRLKSAVDDAPWVLSIEQIGAQFLRLLKSQKGQ